MKLLQVRKMKKPTGIHTAYHFFQGGYIFDHCIISESEDQRRAEVKKMRELLTQNCDFVGYDIDKTQYSTTWKQLFDDVMSGKRRAPYVNLGVL